MQMLQMQMQNEQQKAQMDLQERQIDLQIKQIEAQTKGMESQARVRSAQIDEQSQIVVACEVHDNCSDQGMLEQGQELYWTLTNGASDIRNTSVSRLTILPHDTRPSRPPPVRPFHPTNETPQHRIGISK